MNVRSKRILKGFGTTLCIAGFLLAMAPAQDMPKTTKERIPGAATVKTEQLHGSVVFVEGNDLVVRMSNGEIRQFRVPESRQFVIDGKTLSVHDLKPGTKLTATVTTTATSVTQRTTTVGTGKVWFVAGNTVILTLPNNENRTYKVNEDYRFNVGGEKASVHDLKKGMVISAQKIVEEPMTEIATDTVVTGQAPPPPQPRRTEVARPAPPPPPQQAAPAPAPAAPAPERPTEVAAAPAPAPPSLPKTATQLPLAGLLGMLLTSAGLGLRMLRR